MRFTIRPGQDPVARADPVLLRALGLPSGGVVAVGRSHLLVVGGDVPESTAILIGDVGRANAGVDLNASVEVTRAVLTTADFVVTDGAPMPDPKSLVRSLQGRPITSGDHVFRESGEDGFTVVRVQPDGAGLVGARTRFVTRQEYRSRSPAPPRPDSPTSEPAMVSEEHPEPADSPTAADALTAGLDAERDLLTGWFSLLTSPADLPSAWGLPRVAGVVLEGPHGCGKSELVAAAATAVGARVREVSVDLVFKPERLLDLLETAVKTTVPPAVIFVDRLEAVAGDEALAPFRTQTAAILRWFLDAVAEAPGLACVLGVTSASHLGAIGGSDLLPRSLTIPPPDLHRRELLFRAAVALIPSDDLDHERLAARSAGFSASDVVSAVLNASSRLARDGGTLSMDLLLDSIEETNPSLGSVSLGELPSYGFEKVANLADTKQRLTEAVIWPVTDPDRFRTLGIDPPRGILLYGPPGTGKTFIVRALAHEAGAAFFSVKGAELLDKYVGESERGVREVFGRARAASPAIIFFDEVDALAPVRGRSTTSVTDSVVAALLTEIDGVAERGNVAVIGATNRRDLIDPALLRAGRFEIQIELGLPGLEARRALLEISDVPFAGDVDLDRLAEITAGMSFADLAGVLRESALQALRANRSADTVAWQQVRGAVDGWHRTHGS